MVVPAGNVEFIQSIFGVLVATSVLFAGEIGTGMDGGLADINANRVDGEGPFVAFAKTCHVIHCLLGRSSDSVY
jgi:hypothetical protein